MTEDDDNEARLDQQDEAAVKPLLVIHHSPCADGWTAAWAVWLKHPDAEFVPGVYQQPPPDCTGRDVVMVDFSYKRPVMEQIINVAASVLVLDHHKTAEADLAGIQDDNDAHGIGGRSVTVVFDMTKSGAQLAWAWFHPDESEPLLVSLVADCDLWLFKLLYSRALNAVLFSYDYNFGTWNWLRDELDRDEYHRAAILMQGVAIERKHHKDIKELVGKLRRERCFWNADLVDGAHPWVPCANLPYTLASDAANLMAQDAPFAATYYQDADGAFVFSLRSRDDGADVSAIAARYGGGGHAHAAGFKVASLEDL